MLPKPVTALALSAFVSFASFTATSAVAAPNTSSDSAAVSASSKVKGSHQAPKGKKSTFKKKGHLALHAAEPKESPKESPKLAASLSTHLDMKKVADKHTSVSKKPTLAATGKETFIGGPTGHAAGKAASVHGSAGAMAKSGRAP